MNNYTIYMHVSPSNKRYIGITILKPNKRWNSGRGYKNNQYFTRAIEKYGWDNFQHIIIAKGLDEETAKWLEIELIRELDLQNPNKGYNITDGGDGHKGVNPLDSMTEETRQERNRKISESRKGKSLLDYLNSEEIEQWKNNLSKAFSGENNPMYGKNPRDYMTEEAKIEHDRKISVANSGENHHMYGKHHTEESKMKNSISHLGKNLGKENGNAKSVICLTTKKVFYTLTEGSEYYNCNKSSISACCRGKRKTCGKLSDGTPLVWKYITIIEL